MRDDQDKTQETSKGNRRDALGEEEIRRKVREIQEAGRALRVREMEVKMEGHFSFRTNFKLYSFCVYLSVSLRLTWSLVDECCESLQFLGGVQGDQPGALILTQLVHFDPGEAPVEILHQTH